MKRTGRHIVEAVLKRFGVGEVLDVSPIPLGSQGEKLKVVSPSGTYVLRILDQPRPKYLDYALVFQQEAAQRSALAPSLVRTRDGHMSMEYRGDDFILEDYLPGEPRPISTLAAGVCGALLAQLHSVTQYVTHALSPSGAWEFLSGMSYAHVRALARTCREWDTRAPGFLRHWAVSMERMSASLSVGPPLPRGTHGDVNPTNLLWADGELRFCDFVNASPLPQMVDVVMGVIGLGILEWDFNTHTEILPPSVVHKVEAIHAFVSSYDQARRLLPQEKALLPDALRILWGFWSHWFPSRNEDDLIAIQHLSAEIDDFADGAFQSIVNKP